MAEDDEEEEAEEEEDEEQEWLCGDCNGSGEGMYGGTICRACHGLGVIHDADLRED